MLSNQPILFIRHAQPVGTLLTKDGAKMAYDFRDVVHPMVSPGISEITRKILSGSITSLGDISHSPIIGVHSLSERATQTAQTIIKNIDTYFTPNRSTASRIRILLGLPEKHFYGDMDSLLEVIRHNVKHFCDNRPLIVAVGHEPALAEAELPHEYCEGAVLDLDTARVLERVSFSGEDIFHGLIARYGREKIQENAEFPGVHRCDLSREKISPCLRELGIFEIGNVLQLLQKYQHFDLVYMEPDSTITPHKHHTEAFAFPLQGAGEITLEKSEGMISQPAKQGEIVIFDSGKGHALKAGKEGLLFLAGSVTPIVEGDRVVDLMPIS